MSSTCAYDISHYEAGSALSFWSAYNAGFILAILKASQGLSHDWAYDGFLRRLRTIPGQLVGAYHYGVADHDPVEQADHFLEVADGIPLLALDWEPTVEEYGGTMSLHQAEAFVSRVQEKRGRYPLIYGGSLLKETKIPGSSPLLKCQLWLSQYGPTAVLPKGWSEWRLWQFTGDGQGPLPHDVPGVGRNVDINKFNGTPDDCRRWYEGLSE